MKGAIMQPYLFPYLGYYQLAYEAEKFIFLDDVRYIKKGYINRNSILFQGERREFSVPVSKISQNRNICDHYYVGQFSPFLNLIARAYKMAPQFKYAMPLVESVVLDDDLNVARKNAKSLVAVFDYLGLTRDFSFSSGMTLEEQKKGQDRIISICKNAKIDEYRNAAGGKNLYNTSTFNEVAIDLKFIQSNIQPYPQGRTNFIPHLSIIDILMNCDKTTILSQLSNYSLT